MGEGKLNTRLEEKEGHYEKEWRDTIKEEY